MQRILIVEDEPDMADMIGYNLQRAGYEVIKAHDGVIGTETARRVCPDLIILDIMLPHRDGYAVMSELRRDARMSIIPVIIVTARTQTKDRIQGLEAGADDYLTKPFSPKELVLRIRAVLKRTEAPGSVEFVSGPFRFDKNVLKFYLVGNPVELTSTEFKLLLFLCERFGEPQERSDLLRAIWDHDDDSHSRTLDTHIKRLRQKITPYDTWIQTVRGIGYSLNNPAVRP